MAAAQTATAALNAASKKVVTSKTAESVAKMNAAAAAARPVAAPRGTIKQLRLVQIFPKTTWIADSPRIGIAGEENARAILGTVPVEADGSARFIVPAHKPILFQALDKDGFAYQTMRSTTYVQPGERISCVGCHDTQNSTPPTRLADS